MKDITNRKDVEFMVDTFYSAVREDELLGPIFNRVIQDNWPTHLETMYKFWSTVLLQEMSYKGAPFMQHRKLPISPEHFDRWIYHFYTTIDKHFEGEVAEEAKWRSARMAEMFMYKLESNSY